MVRFIVLAILGGFLYLQLDHEAAAQQRQTDEKSTAQPPPHGALRELPRAAEYQPRCGQPRNREESDLCAQWSAVAASRRANVLAGNANDVARDANDVSAATLDWTRAGFVAILLTLVATAWAALTAARAAKAASESIRLYRQSEAGMLVPQIDLKDFSSIMISLNNRGRTAVGVFHADIGMSTEPPSGPIPLHWTVGAFKSDCLIAEGKFYSFGTLAIKDPRPEIYLQGGVIYHDFSGHFHVSPICCLVDRTTGNVQIHHKADFSLWYGAAERNNAITRKKNGVG